MDLWVLQILLMKLNIHFVIARTLPGDLECRDLAKMSFEVARRCASIMNSIENVSKKHKSR